MIPTYQPRYEAWLRSLGGADVPPLPSIAFSAWISRAKQFALENNLGVSLKPFGLLVEDHDLFTVACNMLGDEGYDKLAMMEIEHRHDS